MAEIFHETTLNWHPVRPELTQGVCGKTLLEGPTKAVLTRVAPGGRFAPHVDAYGHLFYVLAGEARMATGNCTQTVGPGTVVRLVAGEIHGYENIGAQDLLLLSLNLDRA